MKIGEDKKTKITFGIKNYFKGKEEQPKQLIIPMGNNVTIPDSDPLDDIDDQFLMEIEKEERKEAKEERETKEMMENCFLPREKALVIRYSSVKYSIARSNPVAAGYDLTLNPDCTELLNPNGKLTAIDTGIRLSPNYQVAFTTKSNSSLLCRNIEVCEGVIDADYSGNLIVFIRNHNPFTVQLEPGDNLAQLLAYCPPHLGYKKLFPVFEWFPSSQVKFNAMQGNRKSEKYKEAADRYLQVHQMDQCVNPGQLRRKMMRESGFRSLLPRNNLGMGELDHQLKEIEGRGTDYSYAATMESIRLIRRKMDAAKLADRKFNPVRRLAEVEKVGKSSSPLDRELRKERMMILQEEDAKKKEKEKEEPDIIEIDQEELNKASKLLIDDPGFDEDKLLTDDEGSTTEEDSPLLIPSQEEQTQYMELRDKKKVRKRKTCEGGKGKGVGKRSKAKKDQTFV